MSCLCCNVATYTKTKSWFRRTLVLQYFVVIITRSEQGMQALGQLIRFMVAWTHSMFALPFMGAEAFIFFVYDLPIHRLTCCLCLSLLDTKRQLMNGMLLMTSDSISCNHEIRGWQIIWTNSHKQKNLLITVCNSRGDGLWAVIPRIWLG